MQHSPSTAVVLFSGGTDSSLTAIKIGERFERVILLTLIRRGLKHQDFVVEKKEKLCRFFGDGEKYRNELIRTDKLFRFLLYERYFYNLRRHGMVCLAHCGVCKLSFYWRALLYCLEHGITTLADGAVNLANVYPEQNEVMMLSRIRRLYSSFNIHYETPLFDEGERVQDQLYDLRFFHTKNVKGTRADRQIICEQQILYAMFLRHYLPKFEFEKFEKRVGEFFLEKIDRVEQMTRNYLAGGRKGKLASLVEN